MACSSLLFFSSCSSLLEDDAWGLPLEVLWKNGEGGRDDPRGWPPSSSVSPSRHSTRLDIRCPPRNPWSTDNTSRLISAQPLRDPDAAASYAAGISESNLPRISLKFLVRNPIFSKKLQLQVSWEGTGLLIAGKAVATLRASSDEGCNTIATGWAQGVTVARALNAGPDSFTAAITRRRPACVAASGNGSRQTLGRRSRVATPGRTRHPRAAGTKSSPRRSLPPPQGQTKTSMEAT